MYRVRGVAQLVARNVWDVEVAGSSPVTPTRTLEFSDELKPAMRPKGQTQVRVLSPRPQNRHFVEGERERAYQN